MAIELHHLNTHGMMEQAGKVLDGVARLKARIAELEQNLSEIQSQKMQLEDDVALLRRNNAELKEAQRWRKCSEELPEDGAEVLATDGEGIWLCYKTTMPDGLPWFQPDGLPHIEGVTHWRPKPSAPKEDK